VIESRAEVEEGSSWEEEEELELSELAGAVEVVAAGSDDEGVVELASTGLLDEGDWEDEGV